MKRFLPILAVLLLAVLVWFKFQDYRRIHPPEDYEYQAQTQVDPDYHEPSLVEEYFKKAYEVGSFARQMWASHLIDVRNPEADDPQHQHAVNYYNSLKARADFLGLRLSRSLELKQQGFANADIKYMEDNAVTPQAYKILQKLAGNTFKFDDQGQGVWLIQQKLIDLSYEIPHDGIFKTETETALKDWQNKNDMYPSGIADWETLNKLFIK